MTMMTMAMLMMMIKSAKLYLIHPIFIKLNSTELHFNFLEIVCLSKKLEVFLSIEINVYKLKEIPVLA